MKKILLGLSFLFVAFTINAQSIFYEGFNYAIGDTLPSPTWTGVNTGDQIFVTSGSLDYNSFATSAGNKVSFNSSGRDYQRTFTSLTTGAVYMSFLMQVTDTTGLDAINGGYFSGFASNLTNFGSSVWTRKSTNGYNIGLTTRTSTASILWDNTDILKNTVVLVVISYELVSGTANDISKIWINPNSASFGGASEPIPTFTATNTGTDLTAIDRIFIRQDSPTETPFIDMDEIRVGTTWASVTPGITGINENLSENNVSVYPNPATNFVTINSKESISHVNIYDFQGKIVKEYDFNGISDVTLNVADLSKGIYSIVALSTKGNTFNTKLVK